MGGKITNLDEYIRIIEDLDYKGYFTFRGQCCSSWLLEPSVIRRIKKTYPGINEIFESGLLFSLSLKSTLSLIKTAKTKNLCEQDECDLKILAVLQHYGAATPLLDFTGNPLVALYFACQPYKEKGTESDGKVFAINYPDQIRSRESPIIPVSDPTNINVEKDLSYPSRGVWYWNIYETNICKRSEIQESIFVFGWGLYWKYSTKQLIEELEEIVILANNKQDILERLEREHNISKETLFVDEKPQPFNNDIYNFAQSNKYDKVIQNISAEEFYKRGEDYYWNGSPEWAAQYYFMAYTERPDWIDARCKCALSLNWNGEQSTALKIIEDSIEDLGEKWKLLICKAIINKVIEEEWKVDLKKAEKIANDENERHEFQEFIHDYGYGLLVHD